jgi:hypothetical protein
MSWKSAEKDEGQKNAAVFYKSIKSVHMVRSDKFFTQRGQA